MHKGRLSIVLTQGSSDNAHYSSTDWVLWGDCMRFVVCVFTAIVLMTGSARAEGGSNAAVSRVGKSMVLVDPLAMANGNPFALRAERFMSDHWGLNGTLQVGWNGVGGEAARTSGNLQRALRANVGVGLFYYFKGHAPEGVWIGPRLSFGYSRTSVGYRGADISTSSITADTSVITGYTALLGEHVVLQAGVGLGVTLLRIGSEPLPFDGGGGNVSGVSYGLRGLLGLGWLF